MNHGFDFAAAPGHLIRRAHQISVALFNEHLAAVGVTPVQFAILNALLDSPGVDQITLAKRVAFDPATSGSVIGRLESKGWVERFADEVDRRRKLLVLTPLGLQALAGMKSAVADVQAEILSPLEPQEQAQFMHLLSRLVAGHPVP
ncbi:MarR family transcriptional regulator [Limnohabitans sp. 2KL-17]|uniref:MarR family winged helix-turn-helix transcriptional regulator n=1 Tax=Limnohabitans sp. 2KL-17 TaxID=1100704 RepID=UPI000D33EA19|nr:MarR family winged helix-turn-helix transcriptional regulator [Limnohabitans sp. 2KL-17]PUE56868.1 MarR family transcriptional regulator [Limnohabitans sp. 2KL-17]